MRVLVACEYSGKVRDAFRRLGHDAVSCDLLPSDAGGPHYEGSVFDILADGWDLMVGHPSCTYLTNSGVCHLHTDPERWAMLDDAAAFFSALLNAPIPRKCIENPIPHKYALERIGHKYSQIIQPYQFGHMEQKATCLWLEGLPPLEPTHDVKAKMMQLPKRERERLHHLPPGPERWKLRSETYQGIADAMAAQWGAGDRMGQASLL